jgi:hypothetical protein
MVAYVFDDLLAKGAKANKIPGRTADARNWFRNQAQNTKATAPRLISSSDNYVSTPEVGKMYLFQYDPKLKKELPYYDTYPLVFPIDESKGGFLGLNMHYLPLRQRAVLMDALYDTVSNNRYDDSTRLRLSYSILKGASKYKAYKPTIKKYLGSHVRSRFIEIKPVEWDIALFLPIQSFKKASSATVYSDAMKRMS